MSYYDVLVVGAGCLGACVARELSRYNNISVLWLEAADDVSQGATKGNSGIVHAGYDDLPGSIRAKYCWKGNQMYAQLDRELRFGYQKNGSLVVAFNDAEKDVLNELLQRGITNGVQHLRIVERNELMQMEPHLNPKAVAALYAPEAGNVIPYEFAIALAENAVDNGIELRIRRRVTHITTLPQPSSSTNPKNNNNNNNNATDAQFEVTVQHWEPKEYVKAASSRGAASGSSAILQWLGGLVAVHYIADKYGFVPSLLPMDNDHHGTIHLTVLLALGLLIQLDRWLVAPSVRVRKNTPMEDLVQMAGKPEGHKGTPVPVHDMLVGGSGSASVMHGQVVNTEIVKCRYIVNCAGGASDQIAHMIGDHTFQIKPRLGDYLLLNRNQGHLARHTLFPCPDPILGKGVLVQTTLWGNLILGPTARDTNNPVACSMSSSSIQEYILSKCRQLVPTFDAKETIHAFCGARAKSSVGDWIVGPSSKHSHFIHVAGIDSPGLAGAPAIAVDVVQMLQSAGLTLTKNPHFNPNRAPIITPKDGMKGLKMGPVGKFDSDGSNTAQMAQNVVCKCEKVTELEVVRAMRRSLPIDSSQGIRKRTRAGMGHCQGDPDNYNCEARVRAIIARENGVPIDHVGGRPWPATSTLPQRWITDQEKSELQARKDRPSSL